MKINMSKKSRQQVCLCDMMLKKFNLTLKGYVLLLNIPFLFLLISCAVLFSDLRSFEAWNSNTFFIYFITLLYLLVNLFLYPFVAQALRIKLKKKYELIMYSGPISIILFLFAIFFFVFLVNRADV